MICDGKQENIAICFKMYTKDLCFFLPATFELKAVGSFHLILCEQVTLLIIGAELDLIKGGMFYLPLSSSPGRGQSFSPLSIQGGLAVCRINPSSPL